MDKVERLIVDAEAVHDMVESIKEGIPYFARLTDGTRVEIAPGVPDEGVVDEHRSGMHGIELTWER